MIITKNIKFDCAHMLSNYQGKCANLHGHTYHGSVRVEGHTNSKTHMLCDYNDIKHVVDMFDHALIFSASSQRNKAENELYEWADSNNMRMYVMPEEFPKTTAECMSEVIARTIYNLHPEGNNWVVTVILSETDGSFAEARYV